MSAGTERHALEAVWQVMVELAEAANDQVINTQATPSNAAAADISATASDLTILAQAAAVLARRIEAAP